MQHIITVGNFIFSTNPNSDNDRAYHVEPAAGAMPTYSQLRDGMQDFMCQYPHVEVVFAETRCISCKRHGDFTEVLSLHRESNSEAN